jgi:hypothetical protein
MGCSLMISTFRFRPSARSTALVALLAAAASAATLSDATASESPMPVGQVVGQSALDAPATPPLTTLLGFDDLPFAIDDVVLSGAAAQPPRSGCATLRACGDVPHARDGIEKREEVFGPIEQTGWASFANLGNRRIYAFPETVRSTSNPVGASATWGFGAQVDALRMTGLGSSDHEFFAYGELRAAYADMPSPSTDAYRAQLTVGIGF